MSDFYRAMIFGAGAGVLEILLGLVIFGGPG